MMLNHSFQFIFLVTGLKASYIHDNLIWRARGFDQPTLYNSRNTLWSPDCSIPRAKNNRLVYEYPFECSCRGFRHPISWCKHDHYQLGSFLTPRYEVPKPPTICYSCNQNYLLMLRTDYIQQRNQMRIAKDSATYQSNYEFLEKDPHLQKEIILKEDKEEYKKKIKTWFEKQKEIRKSDVKNDVLEKIAGVLWENFENDMKSGALFAGYLCFLTEVFIGFRDQECSSKPNLLKVSESKLVFNLKEIKEATGKWKSCQINFSTIKEGCDKLYIARTHVDPEFCSYSTSKFNISLKLTILRCLKHFFWQDCE